jgi:hypothetical protein
VELVVGYYLSLKMGGEICRMCLCLELKMFIDPHADTGLPNRSGSFLKDLGHFDTNEYRDCLEG